jgi:hypothetical protein
MAHTICRLARSGRPVPGVVRTSVATRARRRGFVERLIIYLTSFYRDELCRNVLHHLMNEVGTRPALGGRQSGPALASRLGVEGSVEELNRQAEMAHVLTCVPQIPD